MSPVAAPPARLPGKAVRRRSVLAGAVASAAVAVLALPATVLAHGPTVPVPPDAASLLFGWSFDPLAWLPAMLALLLWGVGVQRANRAHPLHPIARRRTAYWLVGVFAVLYAVDSGLAAYDTTLFSMHMIQHLLLTLVGPPLLLLAGPITLLLQASTPEVRRRWILPVLHSTVVRRLSFPVVSWIVFAAVMWASHFSPLFDLALENPLAHRLEHALFLVAALLFWWPVIGPDPSPWKLKPSARILYAGLAMPQNTFLALAIYMASAPLYAHYATTSRTWGPSPLEDQQAAGGIMWVGGDIVFITILIGMTWLWMRAEERRSVGEDRRLEAERAAIREREVRLAARRAVEASGAASGASGAGGAASPEPGSPPG